MEAVLLIAAVLIYVGYLAVRMSRHLRVPVVTSFLLLGVVTGPELLNLVDSSAIETLRIVEPVALGMITFAAGEQLHLRDLRALSRRSYGVVGLETLLPVLLVGIGAWLLTKKVEVALPIAAIAGTTGLATVMSTLRESGAKGNYAKLLGVSMATDNFFAILAFSLLLPLAIGLETGRAIGHLYADRLIGMAASVALGCAAGALVAFLIRKVRSSHELLMLVLAHVLLVVGVTEYLGFSILLAGLAMGATAANLTKEERDRDRVFAALLSLEYPVIAIFFLWAGAGLHIRALGTVGLLFAIYIGARLVGKLAGPLLTALLVRGQEEESRRFVGLGMSLLPQAGAAVGLGILARDMLPESGETILAAVLASVVVFELVGPLGVHWAARHVGEAKKKPADEPLTLTEAISELQNRRPRVAVLLGPEADPALLQMPRLLASRLGADLLLVPISDAVVPPASSWGSSESGGDTGEELCDEDGSTLGGCRQIVVDTVSVQHQAADGLVQVLAEFEPAIILMAPSGLPAPVLDIADYLSRRLDCPVLRIPKPGSAMRGRLWRVGGLGRILERSRAVERSRAFWRRSRGSRTAGNVGDGLRKDQSQGTDTGESGGGEAG